MDLNEIVRNYYSIIQLIVIKTPLLSHQILLLCQFNESFMLPKPNQVNQENLSKGLSQLCTTNIEKMALDTNANTAGRADSTK